MGGGCASGTASNLKIFPNSLETLWYLKGYKCMHFPSVVGIPAVHCGNMFRFHNEGPGGSRVPLWTFLQETSHGLLKAALTCLPLERVKTSATMASTFHHPRSLVECDSTRAQITCPISPANVSSAVYPIFSLLYLNTEANHRNSIVPQRFLFTLTSLLYKTLPVLFSPLVLCSVNYLHKLVAFTVTFFMHALNVHHPFVAFSCLLPLQLISCPFCLLTFLLLW